MFLLACYDVVAGRQKEIKRRDSIYTLFFIFIKFTSRLWFLLTCYDVVHAVLLLVTTFHKFVSLFITCFISNPCILWMFCSNGVSDALFDVCNPNGIVCASQ